MMPRCKNQKMLTISETITPPNSTPNCPRHPRTTELDTYKTPNYLKYPGSFTPSVVRLYPKPYNRGSFVVYVSASRPLDTTMDRPRGPGWQQQGFQLGLCRAERETRQRPEEQKHR